MLYHVTVLCTPQFISSHLTAVVLFFLCSTYCTVCVHVQCTVYVRACVRAQKHVCSVCFKVVIFESHFKFDSELR